MEMCTCFRAAPWGPSEASHVSRALSHHARCELDKPKPERGFRAFFVLLGCGCVAQSLLLTVVGRVALYGRTCQCFSLPSGSVACISWRQHFDSVTSNSFTLGASSCEACALSKGRLENAAAQLVEVCFHVCNHRHKPAVPTAMLCDCPWSASREAIRVRYLRALCRSRSGVARAKPLPRHGSLPLSALADTIGIMNIFPADCTRVEQPPSVSRVRCADACPKAPTQKRQHICTVWRSHQRAPACLYSQL